jgi:hypothetical protein
MATLFGALAFATSAAAAPVILQVDANGILTGAQNVAVDGKFYDLTFVDSSCFAVYDGCDSVDDFVFKTFEAAQLASQALLDQVFTGQFDDDPELTLGCSGNGMDCHAFTPYAVANSFADLWDAINSNSLGVDLTRGDTLAFYTSSLAECANCVYADWTETTGTAVPEPSSLLLLGPGIAGIAAKVRKRRKQQLP